MSVVSELRDAKIRRLDISPLVSVTPGTSLSDVIRVMKAERTGCVLICERDRVRGIFTERDVLTKLIGAEVDYQSPVDDFMTPSPRTLSPDQSVGDAIVVMHEGGYRNIPLVDERGRATGVLAVRHIIDFLAEHFPDEVLNLPPRVHQRMDAPEGA